MLDTDTKRRIDTARDILVGKVPDPKSQVEQITIALIYKFMDDMDAESEELGGERKFFAGEFAKYGWAKLMRSGLGGHEMLGLYGEAITRMPENPGIPPLFRDIFKNAYLPYRDPETLRAFLKIIDEFAYDHSERLGDAFEYLLSVLGSQGDAGQFRTPRHIIDFMVSIVDPKKDETVLDPACGTAGFLISSYKHILAANRDAHGNSTLTPDERTRLAGNFKGYDISPDMVRLSLVNMYLHGFTDPHISEYDTLTSQDRWNEYADVILANPPFMSPKGGIRPHNRFSVQSKRSEVLFVDYMAEHLTPKGRAAIIVPEGIVFQSQAAYRRLRKMLVDDYLAIVISLPAGVFNPYSGVKTSILILDKALATQSSPIAFFKVENDGFSLGSQRRPVGENDLPAVRAQVTDLLLRLRANEKLDDWQSDVGLLVSRDRVAGDDNCDLGAERYRETLERSSRYALARLDAVAQVSAGNSAPQGDEHFVDGSIPFIRTSDVGAVHRSAHFSGAADKVNERCFKGNRLRLFPAGTILFPKSGASTFLNYRVLMSEPACVSSHLACIVCDEERALPAFVYRLLCQVDARNLTPDQAYPSLRLGEISAIELPIPSLEEQRRISAEIDGYQKIMDAAMGVVSNYRPRIPIDPEWPLAELGQICDVRDGTHESPRYVSDGYPLITSRNLKHGYIDFDGANLISRQDLDAINRRSKVDDGDILMPMIGTIGNPVIARSSREYAVKNVALIKFLEHSQVDSRFLRDVLASEEMQRHFDSKASGSTQKFIPLRFIRSLPIPIPELATQQAIADEIEAEQSLVAACEELASRFQGKIAAAMTRVWSGLGEASALTGEPRPFS